MGAEWTDCKEIVLNRLKGSGLEVQQAPELIQTLAGWLFRNPNLTLPEINNELKYTKWRGFQLRKSSSSQLGERANSPFVHAVHGEPRRNRCITQWSSPRSPCAPWRAAVRRLR